MFPKKILTLLVFLIISFSNITKTFSMEPDVFVQSTVNRASKVLSSNIGKEQKIEQLKLIADETVDIKIIGLYALGPYRKELNDDQKNKYALLFKEYFLKTFSSRLAEYSNSEIEVTSKKILNKKYTMVSSILVATTKRSEVNISWRIYTKNPENLLIRDLIIEGLSLARTQKEEFSAIIRSNDGNINALFESLRKFIQ